MEETTQRCISCDVTKPLDEFEGYKTCNRCRPLRAAWFYEKRRSDPAWAERSLEVAAGSRARDRARRAEDPEYAEQVRERRRERTRAWRRRQGGFVKGDLVTAECATCSADFEYEFKGRRRGRCDPCWKYAQEYARYGLTGPEVAELLQQTSCEICGSTDPRRKDGRFRIDHCHATGKVRGVLCHPCNIAIGLMQDQPNVLRAAAAYLERTQMEEP